MSRNHLYDALSIHWDHHPQDAAQHYGAGTEVSQIRHYLQTVKPDIVQYHTIGCMGYVNFPSAIAPVVAGLVGDPVMKWAQTCKEEAVAFGCYAASFDCQFPYAVPQWRCINRAGAVSDHNYCPNGPWTEEFFIPFLHEVIDRYHPVHFWLDGAWIPQPDDYCVCEFCKQRYRELYSRPLPKVASADELSGLREFYEQSLDDAIARIARAIRKRDPAILLACNSMYFFDNSRKPISDVDWLSWDVLNTPNLHRTSLESTYISTAGKPADIMLYEQGIVHWQPALLRRPRPIAQMLSETASILAHGNRVCIWHDPEPDGALKADQAQTGKVIADFVRERQEWCIGNDSVADIAILMSRLDHLADPQQQGVVMRALHQLLQEAHIACDIVRDDTLLNRIGQYQLVILPETRAIQIDTAQWLHQYVVDGGCILYVSANTASSDTHWQETLFGSTTTISSARQTGGIVLLNEQRVLTEHLSFSIGGNWECIAPYVDGGAWMVQQFIGEGAIHIITGAALSEYAQTHWTSLRDLIAAAVRQSMAQLPFIEMTGHPGVDVVVNQRDGDLYVHMVNMTPGTPFGAPNELFYDEVCTYNNLAVTIRPSRLPTSLILLPQGVDLMPSTLMSECSETEPYCTLQVTIPELHYHCALKLVGVLDA